MIIVRILVAIVALTAVVSAGTYLVTGDKRYLRFTVQVLKYALFLLLIVLGLLFLERVVAFL